jgi:hypothetical protein
MLRIFVYVRRALVAVVGVMVFLAVTASADARRWSQTPPPDFFFGSGIGFTDGAGSSISNLWAVGENDADLETPIAQRFNGVSWTSTSPRAGLSSDDGGLLGVAVLSAVNVWAVGWQDTGVLVEHYNGAGWTASRVPPSVPGSVLNDVAALSWRRAWAVGATDQGAALILRHSTRGWRVVHTSGDSALTGVIALSPRNVWAVGRGGLVEYFNGTDWTRRSTPLGTGVDFTAIGRVPGTRQLWLIGTNQTTGDPAAVYFNGRRFVARPPLAGGSLIAIAASSGSDVWAAGRTGAGLGFAEHWNGHHWTITSNTDLTAGTIQSISPITNTRNLWATGTTTDGNFGPFAALYH